MRLAAALACALAGPANGEGLSDFVYANALHTLMHEAGHALISEFDLPVLGQEEDAVDAFATSEIIQMMDAEAEAILTDVALAWLIAHDATDPRDYDFYDEHDLDAQRAYRTICHLYGADPDSFRDAADWIDLPQDYREMCEETGPLAMDSWNAMLEAGVLREEAAPMQTVHLNIEPSPAATAAAQSYLMEDVQAYLQDAFAWPEPLTLALENCGEANAYWDPGDRRITLCAEIIEEWQDMERDALN